MQSPALLDSAGFAESVIPVALAVLAVLGVLAVLDVLAVLAVLAVPFGSGGSAAGLCRPTAPTE